jgi:hypothetical protein
MQMAHKQIERVARYKLVISADKSFPDGSIGSVTGDAASRAPKPQEMWIPFGSLEKISSKSPGSHGFAANLRPIAELSRVHGCLGFPSRKSAATTARITAIWVHQLLAI